ncbi:flagellar type III secretion system protein FlhB [Novosphingobium sp. BL-8A]|uniref:EscU/YscU/HrcU family type III secretion system export apparatus switch protein n=1 Tax=Novosphingobium sp. BL-8A TaxID=3127639 RepID=UPI00375738FD
MSEQEGEKSFAPTAKRKKDAAEKGDVIRSREMATAAGVAMGGAWLALAGPWVMDRLLRALATGFTWNRADIDDFTPGQRLLQVLVELLPPILVLGLAVLLVSLVSQLGFGEGRWLGSNVLPKGSRINPLAGLKRMFGPSGWIEMGKGIAKVTLLLTIGWYWARGEIERLVQLGGGDLMGQVSAAWHSITTLLFWLAGGLFLIAMFDLPVQIIRRLSRLKMTLQEVRDENKDAEGAPEKKAAIKQRQRQIAMGALIPAMKEAQFVITNPTQFSVALAYDPAKAPAPVVLAKGRGEKAMAMRELAAEYAVPMLAYPTLARSVFYTTREKQMIREEHYVAIAAILAFVLSLKRGEKRTAPEVAVPVTLRFDADGRLEGTGT